MIGGFFKKLLFGASKRKDTYEKMQALFEDGFTEVKVLELLHTNANEAKDSLLESIYHSILLNIRAGHKTAAEALADFVPPLEKLALLSSSTSNPKIAVENALYVLNSIGKVKGEVKSKLTYPLFLTLIFLYFLSYVGDNLIPMMLDMAPLQKWDPQAVLLHDVSTWFSNNLILVVIMFFGIGSAISYTLPNYRGVTRLYADKYVPGLSVYQDYSSAIFMTALSSQLKSGKSFKQSLESIEKTSPPYLQWHISRMLMNIRAAYKDSEAMDTGLFKREAMANIKAYGQSSSFKDAISRLSERLVDQTVKKVGTFSSTLNFLTMGAIAFTIIWVYSTIMNLSSTLTNVAT